EVYREVAQRVSHVPVEILRQMTLRCLGDRLRTLPLGGDPRFDRVAGGEAGVGSINGTDLIPSPSLRGAPGRPKAATTGRELWAGRHQLVEEIGRKLRMANQPLEFVQAIRELQR